MGDKDSQQRASKIVYVHGFLSKGDDLLAMQVQELGGVVWHWDSGDLSLAEIISDPSLLASYWEKANKTASKESRKLAKHLDSCSLVVGYSLGARIVMEACKRKKPRLAVLVGAAVPFDLDTPTGLNVVNVFSLNDLILMAGFATAARTIAAGWCGLKNCNGNIEMNCGHFEYGKILDLKTLILGAWK